MVTGPEPGPRQVRVCLVGSGTRFVSGISYYTYFLAAELAGRFQMSAVLMRRLIPRWLYPGRRRVGAAITDLATSDVCPTFDGVDWYGIPSVPKALGFLRRQRPDVVILEWWSGSALPWYLVLAGWARRNGAKVVIELHEDLDPGEANLPFVGRLVGTGLRRLLSRASAFVVHSEWDRSRMVQSLGLPAERTFAIPHGPFPIAADPTPRPSSDGGTTILFFGTIRPYKGLEHLVAAFDALPRGGRERWKLLVVGETWEGWTEPLELIRRSPHADDIELVNRYVTDEEVSGFFRRADVVALPYLRSSASGPLHLTMAAGLPVVVTAVGGLVEAATGYSGAVLVEPADVQDIRRGLLEATGLTGIRHTQPQAWAEIGDRFEALVAGLLPATGTRPAGSAMQIGFPG